MRAAIEIANVSKRFRRYRPDRPFMLQEVLARGIRGLMASEHFWALRDVSFEVPRGRAVGIIGTNGSGKSTLLRLAGGIGRADSGRIAVAGRVGALLDLGSGFHADLTGRENVIVAGVLAGLTRQEVLRRFDEIVAFAEIEAFLDNPVRTYSSGMHMRLAFATAVHTNPEILIIDEVLAVGDSAFQRKCLRRIAEFKAQGCSILLVSHGLATVRRLCDDVAWLNAGQLMALGPVSDVVRQYETHVGHTMEAAFELDEDEHGARPGAVALTLLDPHGHPIDRIASGAPLTVALTLGDLAAAPCTISVRLIRDDGLACCELRTETDAGAGSAAPDDLVSLVMERLDLSAGRYHLDVTVQPAGESGSLATRAGRPLTVDGTARYAAVLEVPHHWEVRRSALAG